MTARAVLAHLLHPASLIAIPAAFSFLVWAIPWGESVHRGYARKEDLTLGGAALLLAWYGTAIGAAIVGFRLGRRLTPFRILQEFPRRSYYVTFTVLAAIGVAYSYGRGVAADPDLIVDAIRTQTFNRFRLAVGTEAGVSTLRYAAILSGGIALYELFLRREVRRLHVLNLFLLLAAGLLGSRLSLVAALLVMVAVYVHREERVRLSPWRALALVALFVAAVSTVNHIRNAGYYETVYGVTNPLQSSLYDAISYVSGPFQVSAGVARHAAESTDERIEAARRGAALNRIANPSAEDDVDGWVATATPRAADDGALRPTGDPAVVEAGLKAFEASWPGELTRTGVYVLAERDAAIEVDEGERLYLRAEVSGAASADRPIRLGLAYERRDGSGVVGDWEVSQEGLEPVDTGLTKTNAEDRWPLEGRATVRWGIDEVRVAVWQENPARGPVTLVIDEVVLSALPPAGARPVARSRAAASYVTPTYAPASFADVAYAEETYRRYVDVESGLLTNSAFAAMYTSLGGYAFLVLAGACLLGAAISGHAFGYRSYAFLAVPAIGYAFVELWRLYLFNRGFVHFLVLVIALAPLAVVAARRARRWWARLPSRHERATARGSG